MPLPSKLQARAWEVIGGPPGLVDHQPRQRQQTLGSVRDPLPKSRVGNDSVPYLLTHLHTQTHLHTLLLTHLHTSTHYYSPIYTHPSPYTNTQVPKPTGANSNPLVSGAFEGGLTSKDMFEDQQDSRQYPVDPAAGACVASTGCPA